MSASELLFERRGNAGIVTLNRPQALNSLSLGMVQGIRRILDETCGDENLEALIFRGAGEKAFCAGGDIKAVYQAGAGLTDPAERSALGRLYFADEYKMNRELFEFPKLTVAVMDGITMGGGFGVAGACRVRIATPRTVFAMPEVGIGFFPDVGSMYFLTRCPDLKGLYLALTGNMIGGEDMVALTLANRFMSAQGAADFLGYVEKNNMDISMLLNNFHVPHDSGKETIRNVSKIIADSFGFNTVEEILEALDQQQGDFAAAAAKTIRSRSPTSVKLTHAYYRKMIGKGFRAVTAMDYRLSIRCVLGQEFYEGIRAAVVDKDRNPRWNPSRLEDVVEEVIEGYFADDLPDLDSVA